MIVQELREIQERLGWLPKEEMRALAERLGVPLHRVHEVASFYPLYRLEPPTGVDVKVCRDMACHLHGAPRLIASLEAYGREISRPDCKVEVGGVSCLGQCDRTIAVSINDHYIYRGLNEKQLRMCIDKAAQKGTMPYRKAERTPLPWKIDVYKGNPRYDAVQRFVKGELTADQIIDKLQVSTLKGLGGAGFPTFRKWDTVRKTTDPVKYVVCNADESEPGTFKDRELMRRTPWLVIEGMILAALVTGAERGYIYVRHEYPDEIEVLEEALITARDKFHVVGDNILGSGRKFHLEVYVSPGGYVQGEESSLLEAIEDKRGEPRNKPPFPVFQGLFGKPTVINNVETLSWTPGIMMNGGEWYRDGGINGATGMRFISISGDVVKPGVYEAPFGLTIGELINKWCGGMKDGQKLKAVAPSGPSGGFLPATLRKENMPEKFVKEKMKGADTYNVLDLPMDNNTLSLAGSMLGAAFIVYGDKAGIVENALNCTEFFRNESCGKCVPCRTGSQKLVSMIQEIMAGKAEQTRLPLINELADTMILASICGLGQVASNPITSVIRHFREDVEKYLSKR
jgi:NADH:ubiquinone oxidoreductase subunit F (NADH-binding)/NADH:ubiquinone oxidoreductase subunit E